MSEKDSNALWNKISWKGTYGHSNESKKPTIEALSEHFQKKGESAAEQSTLLCEVIGNNYVEELDREILMEEIHTARRSLKEGKATSDGWDKRMVTDIPLRILHAIHMILNTIFLFRLYHTMWRTTTVNEIFTNKGDTKYAEYYKPVSLV